MDLQVLQSIVRVLEAAVESGERVRVESALEVLAVHVAQLRQTARRGAR